MAGPLASRLPAPLLLITPDPATLPAEADAVTLPEEGSSRSALWRAAAPHLSGGATRRLARQFDLPPDRIVEVARGSETAIWSRARAAAAPALRELGERIVPRARWKDLVLPAETLAALREVAAAAAAREVVESRWRLATPGARGQGLAVLLAGPSGTGKTLAAEVLAGALGLDLFRIDLAGVVSKWIGETEKNLARVFDAAAAGGAVLFFDEADALFGKRSEVNDSHDRYANVEVAYLLQRMEAHRGVSILATNLRANLDHAFLRRLRFAVDLPFPDEAARRAIWARHLPSRAPLAEDLDLDALARLDLPGGAIRNVALNGASLAAAAGERIGMAHLHAAARREFAKLGRPPRGAGR
jgi:SpoVK/Ycf46/Vps4 family AAA+-type ATPase